MANSYFTCVLDAWRDGTTLYGRMHYYRSGTYTYQDTSFPNPTMNLGGSSYADSAFGDRVRGGIQVGDVYSTTFSRTVGGTGTRTVTWTAGSGQRSDFAGTWSKDVGGFPGTTSPPTGLNVTNITPSQDSFTATVSLSGWGTGSGTKYRELQVWTQGMVEPRRYQQQTGDSLSSSITANNNSLGSLSIMPNTLYTIGGYASNGSKSVGSTSFGNYATLPPSSTITPLYITDTAVVIMYSVHDQGGAKTMTLKKQLDSGAAETVTTLTGSGAKSGTFVITGLAPGSTHTLTAEVSTDVGGVVSNTITFTTEVHSNITNPFSLYGAVSGATRRIVKLYGGTTPETDLLPQDWTVGGAHGITFTIDKANKKVTLNGENDGTGNSHMRTFNNGTQNPIHLPAGTYVFNTLPDIANLKWTIAANVGGTTTYYSANKDSNYTVTFTNDMTITSIYLEVNKNNTGVFNNVVVYPKMTSTTGQTIRIDKLYGSVNGKTKLVFGGC